MDFVDVVDAQDRVIGRRPRGSLLEHGFNFRTVHVLVFDDPSTVLLQKIGVEDTRHPGLWGSSSAAYLHAGETYRDAAERRLQEELGLAVPLRDFFKVTMTDLTSLKFVGVWLAPRGDEPLGIDHGHVEAVVPWPLRAIDDALRFDPTQFTATFQQVYRSFRASQPQ